MDSITQAVLGGAIAYAVLGRRLGKRAAVYGLAFGTVPDLDVLIDFGGPIENMTYHRGFSHSVFVQALITPILAWLVSRSKLERGPTFIQWCVAIYLCFVTHSLADFFTVYGTQLFWPLTDHPFAHSILFIVDPIYTLPLIIAVIGALMIRHTDKALRLNKAMLVVSSLYLVWSFGAKLVIDEKIQIALSKHGINPGVYESTPAPLNTLLWRGVAVEGNNYYEIWASVFDDVDQIQVSRFPRNIELLSSIFEHQNIRRLIWFTKGQYKAWQSEEQIFISDLRMGVEGAYVFNFEVGLKRDDGTEIGSFQRLEQQPDLGRLSTVWKRIFDPAVRVSVQP